MNKIMSGIGFLTIAMVVFSIFVFYTESKQEQDRILRERIKRATRIDMMMPDGESTVSITDSALLDISNLDKSPVSITDILNKTVRVSITDSALLDISNLDNFRKHSSLLQEDSIK
jgi:hypothetical protein